MSLLTLDPEDPLPGQRNLPPGLVFVDSQEEWIVEDVWDSKLKRGVLLYIVKYVRHDEP